MQNSDLSVTGYLVLLSGFISFCFSVCLYVCMYGIEKIPSVLQSKQLSVNEFIIANLISLIISIIQFKTRLNPILECWFNYKWQNISFHPHERGDSKSGKQRGNLSDLIKIQGYDLLLTASVDWNLHIWQTERFLHYTDCNEITTGKKWTTINLERAKSNKRVFMTFLRFGIPVAFSVNCLVENY